MNRNGKNKKGEASSKKVPMVGDPNRIELWPIGWRGEKKRGDRRALKKSVGSDVRSLMGVETRRRALITSER